ncbi:hypothetical protein Ate01nite_24340 [Actinoplanes teichomyceticus]|nr:hypothetical protein Ate01nite_24340 [Actinoplanes teichomyceticus]
MGGAAVRAGGVSRYAADRLAPGIAVITGSPDGTSPICSTPPVHAQARVVTTDIAKAVTVATRKVCLTIAQY